MRVKEMGVEGFTVLALSMSSLLLWGSLGGVGAADESGLANECSKDFQSVMTCLNFAQGKVATPTKECCSSVSSIKENEPKCLCYLLQQTQTSGAQNLKSLGVQEAKLLQLPTACQLKNASVSDCPRKCGMDKMEKEKVNAGNNRLKPASCRMVSLGRVVDFYVDQPRERESVRHV
ncbi:non-specific lipid transfer protein GPI-anchored 1 isoform X2 [Herrania umbratica]|uniref:Non-specific lipid transfer protein GPI-anchored 1 isoform X2 n=1 Tax=Herrania umbratica TaxID=108875 RepID=A0A6J0ZX68_9ROSI|nr:non-specific lipid transfer protein GPI-anchored 1 isoform X2 [Herrania umbratica]